MQQNMATATTHGTVTAPAARGRSVVALAACVVSLATVVAMICVPVSQPPAPTSKTLISQIQRLGGRVWGDDYGRVTGVELARVPIGNDDLAVLSQLPHLRWLNLRGINVFKGTLTNDGLRHISKLTQLRSLNLSANLAISDPALNHIRNLTRLEFLNLSGTQVGNDGLRQLHKLTHLKRLRLPTRTWRHGKNREKIWLEGGVDIEGLKHLAGSSIEYFDCSASGKDLFKRLGALANLRRCDGMWGTPTDRDLIHLQRWKRMEVLSIQLSDGWRASFRLRLLKGLSNLRVLSIHGRKSDSDVTDYSGLAALGSLSHLHSLRLHAVTDEALSALSPMPSLRRLDLTYSTITGSGFQALAKFPNLQELALDRFTVTDGGLGQLPYLPNLEVLHLDSMPLSGEGLAWHGKTPDARTTAAVTFTNEGLRHLKHVPNLRVLLLNDVGVTDAGLTHLRDLEKLEVLSLQNSNITDAGKKLFQRMHPKVSVAIDAPP